MAGFDPQTTSAQRRRVVLVLVAAVLGISSSAVLVKLMDATALTIATWRMAGATVLVGLVAGRELQRLRLAHLGSVSVAGVALALHFWAWFASVQYTTVLRSTLLVSLVPLWTALLEGLRGAGWPEARQQRGFGLAMGGLLVIEGLASGEVAGPRALLGDGLAVFAGMLWAVYLSVGRRIRQSLPVTVYFGAVCGVGAVVLASIAGVSGEPLFAVDARTAGLIGLAILGPQLLGHQGFAYAIRWMDATTISLLMLLEPVGATLLALIVLGERPAMAAVIGGLLVVMGVAHATAKRPAGVDNQ
ncbi:MAG: DMT family transporter [Myxococcota bacterium]